VSHLPNRVKTDPGALGDRHGSRQGERDVDQFAASICPPCPLWALAADPDDKTATIFEDWRAARPATLHAPTGCGCASPPPLRPSAVTCSICGWPRSIARVCIFPQPSVAS
jgi:hypothetical protein